MKFSKGFRSIGCILVGVWMLSIPCNAQSIHDTVIIEGDNKPFNIFMILWRGWTDAEDGLKDYLTQRRIAARLIVRNCDRKKSRLPRFIQEAKALQPDLVYTWGTTVSLAVLGAFDEVDPNKHITEIPAIFAIVSFPVGSKLMENFDSSNRNLTGTRYLVPLETQLKTMAAYKSFKTIGVVHNPIERNSQLAVEQLKAAVESSSEEFKVIVKPVPLNEDGEPIADAIPGLVTEIATDYEPDYFYIPPDSFLNINRHKLIGTAMKHSIPSFASAEKPVRKGQAMMGMVSRYYNIGRLTGSKIERILVDKVKPKDIPIESLRKFTLILNMDAILKLGLYPPMNLLKVAEVIKVDETTPYDLAQISK